MKGYFYALDLLYWTSDFYVWMAFCSSLFLMMIVACLAQVVVLTYYAFVTNT